MREGKLEKKNRGSATVKSVWEKNCRYSVREGFQDIGKGENSEKGREGGREGLPSPRAMPQDEAMKDPPGSLLARLLQGHLSTLVYLTVQRGGGGYQKGRLIHTTSLEAQGAKGLHLQPENLEKKGVPCPKR